MQNESPEGEIKQNKFKKNIFSSNLNIPFNEATYFRDCYLVKQFLL